MDRRTRRYKEAIREEAKIERRRQGKKPFYLTLCPEGKPYGPRRPAWIATVNKLAAGLDPSCTHIRKQTHESMCILKGRLNDDCEYSGDLNEDYLRGLLRKAVTRKRTQLISYIRNNKKPAFSGDEDVWLRLEKLAGSDQRLSKTEHGRYANGCRRLVGRTGSVGEAGVRERLRELYGRSPDPEEVMHEMHREKTTGKQERKAGTISKGRIQEGIEVDMDDEAKNTESEEYNQEDYGNEDCNIERRTGGRTGSVQVCMKMYCIYVLGCVLL